MLEERVKKLNDGENPIKGQGTRLNNLVEKVLQQVDFERQSDVTEYKNADYIIVAVQTPVVEEDKKPKYKHLKEALTSIRQNMRKGVTVIIESTIAQVQCKMLLSQS